MNRNTSSFKAWTRAIILVDMNAFFASVEQRDNPEWRGKPVGIVNGRQGTCIITCSYEARAFGVKTGMRLREARKKCSNLIVVPSNPYRYVEASNAIMQALATLTPDIEIFSIDEAFLDVTRCQKLWGSPEYIGQLARQKVWAASHLPCSIGVSGDKTTAKFAAKLNKPNGFTVIPPEQAKERLKNVPVTELCGIGRGIAAFLARYGVYTCGDMEKIPISILGQRFGNLGRRMWYMCQGADPEPVDPTVNAPKSMGHGKVMPPQTCEKEAILVYLRHMAEKLAARLRRHHLQAQHFFIGWRIQRGWLGHVCQTKMPTQDGKTIYTLGLAVFAEVWQGQGVFQVQVSALDPQPEHLQADFFETADQKAAHLNRVIDEINERFGEFKIAPAALLLRTTKHNVISPAWKPFGHRQSL